MKWLFLALVIITLSVTGCTSDNYEATRGDIERLSARISSLQSQSPEIIYVTQNNTIDTIKEVPVTVTVEKIVNGKYCAWQSVGELTDWVKANIVVLWGTTGFRPDCDDYAVRLYNLAYAQGRPLSLQAVWQGELQGVPVSNFMERHLGNMAIVGNEIYFIEPQPMFFRISYISDVD
jgi:hypothetical protein